MGVADARETLASDQPLGYSAHEQVEAEGDRAAHVDYFFFSPIFPTPSKPDHPGVGLAALRAFCRAAPVPVWALGGITPERVADCRQAGAQGVAVCSGIMDVSAPIAAVRAYRRALRTLA
jgi:thiamine-phosphate pyrophosphorylase